MSGDKLDYKSSKEAFVSGVAGSTIMHVNLASSVTLCSFVLYTAIRSRLPSTYSTNLLLEWTVLVLPLVLSMTLFAEKPLLLCLLLLVPTFVLFKLPRKEHDDPPLSPSVSRAPSPSHSFNNPSGDSSSQPSNSRIVIAQLPALTIYRAHMLLMTFLVILAVDFPVFPRSLVKCDTFGVSLMDLGIGSFVFSQGVVSAIPLVKNPAHLLVLTPPKIIAVSKKMLPLFVLGVVRVISVKGAEYPEHELEYGTHWNFFFTMAIIPLLEIALHPVMVHLPISLLGFLVALSHQLALSITPLQNYTLNSLRTNLINANKEGLVSLTGYLAIHLLGLSVGTLIFPPSPSDFRREQSRLRSQLRGTATTSASSSESNQVNAGQATTTATAPPKRQDDKTIIELFSYGFLWWTCLGLCYLTDVGGGVSRRLANLPYVIWTAAYNTSFVMFYLILDNLAPLKTKRAHASRTSPSSLHLPPSSYFTNAVTKSESEAPPLLQAINLNGLALFLLANVATGLINLSMATMYASNSVAMVVLSAYSFSLCSVAWLCRKRRLWKL
ncbi:GWT1-domain-containing protein [Lentinula aciculospora]|uniref:GPI-anchored wall transfer protein n=1 Tax=Lentinula aciculospora TaxID=153920 RepID=A0A9W9DJU8_9AGAR|nr:GWT1-domain-containing protein [Lentinula aciculospora]